MGEVEEAETETVTDSTPAEASADLEAGFTDAPAESAPAEPQAPAEPETPAPVYVQLTEGDHKRFLASADKIDKIEGSLEGRFASLFGKFGPLEQRLKEFTTPTPRGTVEASDEDLKELKEAFPEFADMTKTALNRVLSRMHGSPAQAFDPEKVKELAKGVLTSSKRELKQEWATEMLDGLQEDWRTIVGLRLPDGSFPQTAYRLWLAQQPKEYADKLLDSDNPFAIQKSIKAFQDSTKPKPQPQPKNPQPSPQQTAQRARFSAAVTPKGEGTGGKGGGLSDVEALEAGFNE